MPFKNVTPIILADEIPEMELIIKNNPEARETHEQFEAEYRLRHELSKIQKSEYGIDTAKRKAELILQSKHK